MLERKNKIGIFLKYRFAPRKGLNTQIRVLGGLVCPVAEGTMPKEIESEESERSGSTDCSLVFNYGASQMTVEDAREIIETGQTYFDYYKVGCTRLLACGESRRWPDG